MANELTQDFSERKVCTKCEHNNCSTVLATRVRMYNIRVHKLSGKKPLKTFSGDQDQCSFNDKGNLTLIFICIAHFLFGSSETQDDDTQGLVSSQDSFPTSFIIFKVYLNCSELILLYLILRFRTNTTCQMYKS